MTYRWPIALLLALAPATALAAEGQPSARDLARVVVVTAKSTDVAADVVLTGEIRAQTQTDIAFRVPGRVAERRVDVGVHVDPDDVLARIDPQEQEADVQNAVAGANSAQAVLLQAQLDFKRQESLLKSGYATRAAYDTAQATLSTAQASFDAAQATLQTVREQRSYTDLKAGLSGVVVARSIETGQVVQAGQKAFTLAQDGPRDAIFNVYESVLAAPPGDGKVKVTLLSDPSVSTVGTVREIAPTVDAATSSVQVKIGLAAVPPQMTLGSSVIGRAAFRPMRAVTLPWTALFRWLGKPAVWIFDPGTKTVAPRTVAIDRYLDKTVVISKGIVDGDSVVVAGIQVLRPGETVLAAETTP